MPENINWGIMGLGKIAHKFAQDLMLSESGELHAVASRDLAKAKEFGEKYNSSKVFGSYEEMVQDADLDVVYIATPHVFHCDNTLLCLENNKAVLCEKAFAMNQAEVRSMTEMATEMDLFLMEALWTRFIPAIEKVLELVNSAKIGEVERVEANFGFKANYDPSGRLFNKDLGGGALLDIGIYPVYFSYLILGEPDSIEAKAEFVNDVDAACKMEFRYSGDATSVLDCTLTEDTSTDAVIFGSGGHIKVHRRFHHPEKITLKLKNGSEETFEIPYIGNGYYHEIEEVNSCLLQGQKSSSRMSHNNSLSLIRTLDRVREKIGLRYSSD